MVVTRTVMSGKTHVFWQITTATLSHYSFFVFRTCPTKTNIGMRSASNAVIVRTRWLTNPLRQKRSVFTALIVMITTLLHDVMAARISLELVKLEKSLSFSFRIAMPRFIPLGVVCSLFVGMKKFEFRGKQWHEECFGCGVCKQPIGNKRFIPRDNEFVCVPCYEEQFAQRCAKCNGVS